MYEHDSLLKTARHESAHVIHGELCGYKPHTVRVGLDGEVTYLVYPLSTQTLPRYMAENAAQTALHLAEILGTVMAGYMAASEPFHGRDAQDLQDWKDAYLHCGELSDWLNLKAAVERGLIAWARHPSVARAVETMAGILVTARELKTRPAVETMLGAARIAHVP